MIQLIKVQFNIRSRYGVSVYLYLSYWLNFSGSLGSVLVRRDSIGYHCFGSSVRSSSVQFAVSFCRFRVCRLNRNWQRPSLRRVRSSVRFWFGLKREGRREISGGDILSNTLYINIPSAL